MLQLLLKNGTHAENTDLLNSRIQISNLIALITLVTVGLYTPLYFLINQPEGAVNNLIFCVAAATLMILNRYRKHTAGFHLHLCAGYVYFILGTMLFGTSTNLYLFLIPMSMIVMVLMDDRWTILGYNLFGTGAFISLLVFFPAHTGFIPLRNEALAVQTWVSLINLVLLAVICAVLVWFFKTRILSDRQLIAEQRNELELRNREIQESLRYSERIQRSLQGSDQNLEKLFPQHVLFYRPKDVVSGDFYLCLEVDKFTFVIVADCTGHGVPGALMSVLGITHLRRIIEHEGCFDPAEILTELREAIVRSIGHDADGKPHRDGMDISIIRFHRDDSTFMAASANNPVYHFSGNQLQKIAGDRQAVGFTEMPQPFTIHSGICEPGDWFFLASDGMQDQFGGPDNKKFMQKRLIESLARIAAGDNHCLHSQFESWKGNNEQIDDVTVLGIRV